MKVHLLWCLMSCDVIGFSVEFLSSDRRSHEMQHMIVPATNHATGGSSCSAAPLMGHNSSYHAMAHRSSRRLRRFHPWLTLIFLKPSSDMYATESHTPRSTIHVMCYVIRMTTTIVFATEVKIPRSTIHTTSQLQLSH